MMNSRRIAASAGLLVLGVYFVTTTGVVSGRDVVTRSLAFAIGPVAIIGIFRLLDTLNSDRHRQAIRICRVFLVSAFVLFTTMVILQQMTLLQFRALEASVPALGTGETLRVVRAGVNFTQLGIDVAFDVFYCAGVMILGGVLYSLPAFGRVIGALGVAAAGALLVVNLMAFPSVPTEVGLPDLGPVTALWWVLVIGLQLRRSRTLALTAA
jgi:hypothetical protein